MEESPQNVDAGNEEQKKRKKLKEFLTMKEN
jgi:hypothetical protein